METRAHYVAVGIFVLAMVFLGFVAVLWLTRVQLSEELARYYIFFRGSVTGLSKGASVQYNGIPVGRVVDVRVDPDNVQQIQVTAEIDRNLVKIRTDARAYLESNILSGVSTVQIRGGTEAAPDLKPKPGHKYPIIRAGESSLQRVYATAPELMERVVTVADHLDKLLNRKNRQAFSQSLANLDILTARLARRSAEMRTVLTSANSTVLELDTLVHHVDQSYTAPDGLKDQAARLLTDYDRLALNVNNTNRQLQALIADIRPGVRGFTGRTLVETNALLAETRQLVSNLNGTVSEIRRNPSSVLFGANRAGYRPQ